MTPTEIAHLTCADCFEPAIVITSRGPRCPLHLTVDVRHAQSLHPSRRQERES